MSRVFKEMSAAGLPGGLDRFFWGKTDIQIAASLYTYRRLL
jgi:hypothetical protein